MRRISKKWLLLLPAGLLCLAAFILFMRERNKTPVPNSIAAKAAALLMTDQEQIDQVDVNAWQRDGYGTAMPDTDTGTDGETAGTGLMGETANGPDRQAEDTGQPQTSEAGMEAESAWYAKYMCWLYENDLLDAKEVPLEKAGEPLTYGTFFHFLDQIGCRDMVSEPLGRFLPFLQVPETVWWQTYESILEQREGHGIAREEYTVMGTPACFYGLEDWQAVTDRGTVYFEGLVLDTYLDCRVEALVKDRQMICLTRLVTDEVTYSNVWLTGSNENELDVFLYGYERTFSGSGLPENCNGVLADVTIQNHMVSQVVLKRESVQAKVLSVGEHDIELEGYGKVPLAEDFRVYKVYGDVELQDDASILIGYDIQEFVVADGVICAALTVKALEASNIRVLITDSDFSSIWHDRVVITSNDSFRVRCDDWEQTFAAGELLDLTIGHEWLTRGRLTVTSDSYAGELQVVSVDRSQGNPSYKGNLEITAEEEGLLLVNELLLEEYLCRVVPSEMPASYPVEALKAQAICARSYAYRQILNNACRAYGAHVDDSTYYQVYNNMEEQKSTTQAVQETYGQVAFWQEEAIQAYYYSTGWGVSEDAQIWGNAPEGYEYLKVKELHGGAPLDVQADYSAEEAFRAKIDGAFDAASSDLTETSAGPADFDSAYPWYRWKTTVTAEELSGILNRQLPDALERYPESVWAEGEVSPEAVFSGPVTSVEVTRRLRGGTADEVKVTDGTTTVYLNGQQRIRSLMGDDSMVYEKYDGTPDHKSALPSAFFYTETSEGEDGTRSFTFVGGGFGHGVGMSQNGAAAMARAGMSCSDILNFFYEGIVLSPLY